MFLLFERAERKIKLQTYRPKDPEKLDPWGYFLILGAVWRKHTLLACSVQLAILWEKSKHQKKSKGRFSEAVVNEKSLRTPDHPRGSL